jgi:hypothetical protein
MTYSSEFISEFMCSHQSRLLSQHLFYNERKPEFNNRFACLPGSNQTQNTESLDIDY